MPDVAGMYRRFGVSLRAPSDASDWATVRCFTGTHDDRHPSARVHLRSGGFRCFTCGVAGGALAALELLGVTDPADRVQLAVDYGILDQPIQPKPRPARTPPRPPAKANTGAARAANTGAARVDYDLLPRAATPTRERSWEYVNATGEPAGRVRRLDLPDGSKRIWQERPDGNGGWLTGLAGGTLPLYRLPLVLTAAAHGLPVIVVEGEKACDALERVGLLATTSAGGAGKWRPDHTRSLVGATVTAIADCDLAGRLHAIDVSEQALAAGIAVSDPLDLAELRNDGYDVVDYLAGIAEAIRAASPGLDAGELRARLRRNLEHQLARRLPATGRSLQLLVERARHTADPEGHQLLTCARCGHERPHRVTHGYGYCPCGAFQVMP